MYTYGLFMLIFDRKQNSVKQLSFNKKINRKKAIFRAFLLKLSVVTNVPNIYGDRNAFESFYLRLGLEPTWLGLEPCQNPQYLVSGPSEVQVLDVSSQKEFSERQ